VTGDAEMMERLSSPARRDVPTPPSRGRTRFRRERNRTVVAGKRPATRAASFA
jgi:hypothetical protein